MSLRESILFRQSTSFHASIVIDAFYPFETNNKLQHVIGQHQANPVMVSRGLPTTKEWGDMLTDHPEWGLRLDQEPADPRSDRDLSEGYLAVLSKM